MKISKILLFSIVMGGLVTSCEKAYVLPEPVEIIDPTLPVDSVKFSLTIQPIFTAKCIVCHSNGDQVPELTDGNSYSALTTGGYINTATPSTSLLYTKINGGSMTSYPNQAEKDNILKWITQGAKNN